MHCSHRSSYSHWISDLTPVHALQQGTGNFSVPPLRLNGYPTSTATSTNYQTLKHPSSALHWLLKLTERQLHTMKNKPYRVPYALPFALF
jgi:hypothetical protein